jgi:hypothetical protein
VAELRRGFGGPKRRGCCGRRAEEDGDLVCLVVVDDCFLLRGVGAAGARLWRRQPFGWPRGSRSAVI